MSLVIDFLATANVANGSQKYRIINAIAICFERFDLMLAKQFTVWEIHCPSNGQTVETGNTEIGVEKYPAPVRD